MISVPVFVYACGGRGILRPVERTRRITIKDFVRLIIVCLSLTYIFNFVGVMVNEQISKLVGHTVVNPLTVLESTNPFLMFLCTGLISPFVEEIMFRGVLLKKLRPYGDRLAIWFSAIAFGLYHGNFSQFFYAVAIGVVLGGIVVKTNKLVYTILLHIAINICGSFIIPGILEQENIIISTAGLVALLVLIVYGVGLGIKMLPHLKTGEKLRVADIRDAVSNPGVISFLIASCIMFCSAIFA
jgi:membrane protease YdiL (CAAX protease family)